MIYLATYHEIKKLTDERVQRSLAMYELQREPAEPVRLVTETEADVIELVFAANCDSNQIGA
ncbi:MAG TPA: hypothetical protein VMQ46_04655 [Acidimicrobiia bacterium]|nr:hypothetical protein [Acidimicrobiia bacterium]